MTWSRLFGDNRPVEVDRLPDDPGADTFRPPTREWTVEVISEEDEPELFLTEKMDGPPVLRASQEGLPPRKQRQHVLSAAHQPGRLMGAVWSLRDPIVLPGAAGIAGLLVGLACGLVVGVGACVTAVGAVVLWAAQ